MKIPQFKKGKGSTKSEYVILVPFFLSCIAAVEISLRYYYSGNDGLINAINDPGMSLFHLIILPTAIYLYIQLFGLGYLGSLFRKTSKTVILYLVVIISVLSALMIHWGLEKNQEYLFSNKFYVFPEDVNDTTARKLVTQIRANFINNFKEKVGRGSYSKWIDSLATKYEETLDEIPNRDGVSDATFHSILGGLEAMLAVIFVLILLLTIILVILANEPEKDIKILDAVKIMSLICVWFFLRMYSVMYTNILKPKPENYFGINAAMVTFVMALGILVLYLGIKRVIAKESILKAVVGALAVMIGYNTFDKVVEHCIINGSEQTLIYEIFIATFILIAASIAVRDK